MVAGGKLTDEILMLLGSLEDVSERLLNREITVGEALCAIEQSTGLVRSHPEMIEALRKAREPAS